MEERSAVPVMASLLAIVFICFSNVKYFFFIFDSEEDLSSTSDSSSSNSSSQNGVKQPLSPREFWKEKAGEWDKKVSAGISTKQ